MFFRTVQVFVAVPLAMTGAAPPTRAEGGDCSPGRNDAPKVEYHVTVEPGAAPQIFVALSPKSMNGSPIG